MRPAGFVCEIRLPSSAFQPPPTRNWSLRNSNPSANLYAAVSDLWIFPHACSNGSKPLWKRWPLAYLKTCKDNAPSAA